MYPSMYLLANVSPGLHRRWELTEHELIILLVVYRSIVTMLLPLLTISISQVAAAQIVATTTPANPPPAPGARWKNN